MGILVEELARVLDPYRGFRLGADGSVSVYPASPRVLLPGQSSSWRTAKPQPAPARAQAVPKPETAAQLARREHSQIRLRQKHLASKIWASLSRRAKALHHRYDRMREKRAGSLDNFVELCAPPFSLGPSAAAQEATAVSLLAWLGGREGLGGGGGAGWGAGERVALRPSVALQLAGSRVALAAAASAEGGGWLGGGGAASARAVLGLAAAGLPLSTTSPVPAAQRGVGI